MAYIYNSKQDILTGLTSTTGTIAATDTILGAFGKVLNLQGKSFLQSGNAFGANAVLGSTDNFPLQFITNNTVKATILANGNFGIGTAAPSVALDVIGAGSFSTNLTVGGDLTVNGTTTTINTTNLDVQDKNISMGVVGSPTDVTANGGGFTLKGATDKTITWLSTDSLWHYNQGIGLDNQTGVRFYELSANGTNYVEIKAPATLGADFSYTLPSTAGSAGSVLTTNGSGVLSWSSTAGLLTASNGLTATGTDVALGGTIGTPTTVSITSGNNLQISHTGGGALGFGFSGNVYLENTNGGKYSAFDTNTATSALIQHQNGGGTQVSLELLASASGSQINANAALLALNWQGLRSNVDIANLASDSLVTKQYVDNRTSQDTNITTVSGATYTALTTDYLLYITANTTITLPAGVLGQVLKFAVRNVTTTVNAAGANLINGTASITLNPYNFVTLRYLGTNDWVIGD